MGKLLFTLLLIPIGIAFTFLMYCSIPLIVAYKRKKPISTSRLKWLCVLLIAVVFIPLSVLIILSSDGIYSANATAAFFWGVIAYYLMKKRLQKRGLLLKPENPVLEPAPPVEAVDYSADLSEYTFITPGEKKTSQPVQSANTEPHQPQVVGVQANVHGNIVSPVSASDQESSKADPVQQSVAPNKHTGLKVFSMFTTLLLISVLLFAVWSQVALKKANEALAETEAEMQQLALRNIALIKSAENARADQTAAEEKVAELEEELTDAIFDGMDYYFALKQIGFIYQGYKNYHFYGCELTENATHFHAHNINYCESLGYDPCPVCWEN